MTESAYRWMMTSVGEPLITEPFDLQPPDAGEVVVEVAGCGVCHTDLGFYYDGVRVRHPLPLTLGHEISGHVIAAGADVDVQPGSTVLIPAVIPCGVCDQCRRGRFAICPNQKMPGNDIHGGFASHVTVPAYGLCMVDEQRLQRAGLALADVSVAVIAGYNYGGQIDAWVDSAPANAVVAHGRTPLRNNLRMLLAGRVDTLVESPLVMGALLEGQGLEGKVIEAGRVAEQQPFYFACTPAERGRRFVRLYNDAVQHLRQGSELHRIYARYRVPEPFGGP